MRTTPISVELQHVWVCMGFAAKCHGNPTWLMCEILLPLAPNSRRALQVAGARRMSAWNYFVRFDGLKHKNQNASRLEVKLPHEFSTAWWVPLCG